MTSLQSACRKLWLVAALAACPAAALAHSGPPFPILSDRVAGPYRISIWTDPDATDDGSAAGQFWVMIDLADGSALPADTRATIAIRPLDRTGAVPAGRTDPVNDDVSRQFAALLMDHEGPFAVQATVSGARGTAAVDARVDATYDMRPARWLLVLYLMPFVAVGLLWIKVLTRRRRDRPSVPAR